MDDQQRQRINGAAREFSGALVAAYRTTSDGTATAQQLGAQQIEYFFDTVMDNLRAQAEGTSQMTRQLAAQQELARGHAGTRAGLGGQLRGFPGLRVFLLPRGDVEDSEARR